MSRLMGLFGTSQSGYASRLGFFARHRVAVLLVALGVVVGSIAAVAQAPPDRDGDGLPDAAEIRLGTYAKNVADSDGDGVNDADEDVDHNGIIGPLETDPARPDTDGDGLNDGKEWGKVPIAVNGISYPVAPAVLSIDVDGDGIHNGRDLDSDNDGITDRDELGGNFYPGYPNKQSNPYLSDTDNDGLFDREEATWGTNPALANSDGDGLTDGQEVAFGTDPLATDTDRDGLPDGMGVDSVNEDVDGDGDKNALDWDADNDGLRDGDEDLNDNGYQAGEMDAAKFDTDGDGWPDGYEYHRRFAPFLMNAVVAETDTDNDGLPNGIEVGWWKTKPDNNDSDGDGIFDKLEGPAGIGFFTNTAGDLLPLDTDNDKLPNALDSDSDNDGLTDKFESADEPDQDPAQGTQRTSPWLADSDDDGLSDAMEINVYGTNPLNKHSDTDGIEDGAEVKTYKTDPRTDDTDGDGVPESLTGNESVTLDSDGDGRLNAIDGDSDGDGLPDGEEDADHNGAVNGNETSPVLTDSEPSVNGGPIGDGLPDWFEVRILGANATPNTKYAISRDGDGDGISDFDELRNLGSRSVPSIQPMPGLAPAKQQIYPYVPLAKGESDKRVGDSALKSGAVRDAEGYLATDSDSSGGPTFGWVDITGVGTPVVLTGDDLISAPIAMGMSFPFYENAFTDVRVCTNGFLSFTDTGTEFTNQPLPNPGGLANMVAPMWDDLHFGTVQRAYTHYDGARFIVEWQAVPHFGGGGPYTFEAILYPNGNIEYQYLSLAAPTNSATVGIQNATKSIGLNLAFDTPYLHDNLAVRIVNTNRHLIATGPTKLDSDGDGVPDGTEYNVWHSNPLSKDTDGDGIEDGQTVTITYIDASGNTNTADHYVEDNGDADGDGVPNVLDVNSDSDNRFIGDVDYRDRTEMAYATGHLGPLNPGNIDTDHDQVTDISEIRGGSNPLDARQRTITPTPPQDSDSDGLYDDEETILGLNKFAMDSDGDGLNDGEELDPIGIDYDHAGPNPPGQDVDGVTQVVATNPRPLHTDSDGDGITDGDELDPTIGRTLITDPNTPDSDGDGVTDDMDGGPATDASDYGPVNPDRDNDMLLDGWEDADNSGGQNGDETDATNADTDGDGGGSPLMNDAQEKYQWQTDAVNPANDNKDGGQGDTVTDSDEVLGYGTDPSDPDTDHDGLKDGEEANIGTDSNNRDGDNDGLVDGQEAHQSFTSYGAPGSGYPALLKLYDPFNNDSDNDLMWDGAEAAMNLPIGGMSGQDADGDGLTDGQEAPTDAAFSKELLGYQRVGSYLANPNLGDSDGDQIGDATEGVTLANDDPDGDGAVNAMDVDSDNDWIRDGRLNAADPRLDETYAAGKDIDADGIPNARDGDSHDNDRLLDPLEFFLFDPGLAMNDSDRDDDGLLDGNEYWHSFFNPFTVSLGAGAGVANNDVRVRSNPMDLDTDRDGLKDGLEAGLARAQLAVPAPTDPSVGQTIGGLAAYDANPGVPLGSSATSNSDPVRWDTDADGLADGNEDWDKNGRDLDHTPLAGAIETDPNNQDSDKDELFDGTENGNRSGNPVYNSGSGDFANALVADTDHDLINDGPEAGPDVAFTALRTPSPYFTKVTDPNSDGDGYSDGEEDADHDGVRDPLETDANNCDTDNDQTLDHLDTLPLDPALGGATWALTTSRPATATATPTGSGNSDFFKATWPIVATNSSLKDLKSFYAVSTEFTWTADYGNYVTPLGYAHPPIPADRISVKLPGTVSPLPGLDNCYPLTANAAHTYEFALKNIPASTAPGSYEGTIYFLASAVDCPNGQLPCPVQIPPPGSVTAVSTLTHYDSMQVTINIPPYYDLDVLNDDPTNPQYGVGQSNPADFHSGGAVANEMHLKGMAKHDGLLTGVFRVSVPNGDAANGRPVYPSTKWDSDPPSNARLNAVKFRFESTSVPALPSSAIGFVPVPISDFDLGTEQTVEVQVNTKDVGDCGPVGRFEGNVVAWHDLNGDDSQNNGEDGDQFVLSIELVTPDLDIQDDQGSLAANRLEANVNPAASLPQWTIRAANPSTGTNYDAFDGPGCEAFGTPSIFQAQSRTETPILTNVAVGVTPSPGSTATFRVVKYDPTTLAYDETKSFNVMVWSEQSGTIARDASQEFKLGVDPTSLSSNPPQGLYTPYYAAGHGDNQYALLSARGTASGHARAARGYPVTYNGTGTPSPEYGLFDRFQVFLTYQPSCAIAVGAPTALELDPGAGGTVTAVITNALCNVTGLELSRTALTRSGGTEVISDVTLSIDQNTLNPAEQTTARVVVRPADCQLDGRYTGTITVTGNSGSGQVTTHFDVAVDVRTKAVAVTPAGPITANPGVPTQWAVVVINSGTAPIKVGELQASLPSLNGSGAPITGLTIDPDPTTVSIDPRMSQEFIVNATSAINQQNGRYTGNIAWVVCNRAAVPLELTLEVNLLQCAMALVLPEPATVDPAHCVIVTTGLKNGQCAMRNLTVSSTPLSGAGGVIPVTLDIGKNNLVADEETAVRLSTCPAACLLDGSYTSLLTVTGTTDFGPETVSQPVTINVRSKAVAVTPVGGHAANPGVPVQWTVVVTNSGTAPIEVGELQASLPSLNGSGAPITGLTIDPNPSTVSIDSYASHQFSVNATSAINQQYGTYTGNIAWVVCNRAAVNQELTLDVRQLLCPPTLAPTSLATVDPGRCVVVATVLKNGQCAMRDITLSSSPLSGAGGVIPVTLDIGKNNLVVGEETTVRLSACAAACLLDGSYTSLLTVTGTTDFGPETVSQPVTVNLRSKAVAVTPVARITANPGVPVQWTVVVTNSGTAPIEVGELQASLPSLSGPGAPITGLTISPNPTTVSIQSSASLQFSVNATSAINQKDGDYIGNIAWVVCNRPVINQPLPLRVNPLPCSPALAPVSLATVDPAHCVVVTTELTNGECAMRDITLSCGSLSGAGGAIPVTLDIDRNSLVPGEKTTVRLSACPPACLLDGTYNCTLTATGNTEFGPYAVSRPITVVVTSKGVAAAQVDAVVSNPGLPVQWTVLLTNSGTAPIEVGELRVALPTLERITAGVSDPVAGLVITPDPTTVSIPVGMNRSFQVSATLGGDQRDGRYRDNLGWVVCNHQAVSQELVLDVKAVPAWSYSAEPANLTCSTPLSVMVTNQGNTDLLLTVKTLSGPTVIATPDPLPVLYRSAPQPLTLSVPCGALTAGLKNGEIACQDGTSGPTRPLPVITTVSEVPALTSVPAPAVPQGVPGGVVTIKIPVQNTGNVRLKNVRIVQAREFQSGRGGASIPFPELPIPAVDRSLEIGARDTIVISVNVGSGYFAGTYSSRIKLRGESGSAETFVSRDVVFDLGGTPDRQIAFSDNPVRFAQARAVTIALGTTNKPASIMIYNSIGVLVRNLANSRMLSSGATTWDFKNDNGVVVASGVYLVVVEVDGKRHKEKLLFIK